jgi:glutamate racemase
LEKEIDRMMGKKCRVISSATAAVNAIGDYFKRHPGLEKSLSRKGKRVYYTTDSAERFSELGSRFLGSTITGEKVEI